MKIRNYILTLLSLTFATVVTAGSMYITVGASVQQESAAAGGFDSPVQDTEPNVDGQAELVPNFVPPLLPEEVIHDRSQQISLDSKGGFKGRLSALTDSNSSPAAGYTVKVLQNGVAVGVTTTNEQGRFSFAGLQPGVAGILAFNENGLMLYGVQLVASDPLGNVAEVELNIDSTVVAGADIQLAREMILSALTREELRFSEAVTAADDQFSYGTGEPSTTLISQPIQLRPDGTLHGTVNVMDERTGRIREVLDMSAFFLQNGKVASSAEVNRNGSFVVSGLKPGVYSVVGKGLDGVFAFGVEVIAADSGALADIHSRNAIPVSIKASPEFSASPVRSTNLNPDNIAGLADGTITSAAPVGAGVIPQPGMGSGGGGIGGGGAGAGGGGMGALVGALAGGIAGWLAADSNNDDNVTPASPGL